MVLKIKNIKKVAVVGAGTMGQGISQLLALTGYNITWCDVNEQILEKGFLKIKESLDKAISLGKITKESKQQALQNLELSSNINDLVADLIIEAVVEKFEVKVKVFEALEKNNSPSTILATNTSSIPITKIAARLQHPERLIGMHFFNPVHSMQLVELIFGIETTSHVGEIVKNFALTLGKNPVFAQDSPGFIVNRVARSYYVESLKILEENIADVETIDKLMEATGFKMGPFRLMDLIGVDTNYEVTLSMYNAFHQDPKFRPSRIQENKVLAGHHGRKAKKGFYEY
jgi:3-hydroxybutyryl-CoA dehydrogenase